MITLRGNRIIVKILPPEKLPLNLIAVDVGKTWAKDQLQAEVIVTGPDCTELQEGDVIVITGSAGSWIDRGVVNDDDRDSTYRHLTEDDDGILGVLVSEKLEAVSA